MGQIYQRLTSDQEELITEGPREDKLIGRSFPGKGEVLGRVEGTVLQTGKPLDGPRLSSPKGKDGPTLEEISKKAREVKKTFDLDAVIDKDGIRFESDGGDTDGR